MKEWIKLKNKALIVCCENDLNLKVFEKSHYIVGVERGCLDLIHKSILIDDAISDFDSVTKKEIQHIRDNVKNFVKLNEEKDFLDGVAAIQHVINKYNINDISIVLKPTKRMDFNLSIIELVEYYNVKIINDFSLAFKLKKGRNVLEYFRYDSFKYVSLFPLKNSIITIKNMKYCVEEMLFEKHKTVGFSNELINQLNPEIITNEEVIIIFTK
ncbi:thiamine pyrophosphokinase [Spiroplasma litorale]|uniref:Thiamine pyrophosphokinase n=1 Tax=Spiroplasma litorale TaxID=216942 RepID=A0A0K1W0L7_9MOLU|nr:hypothetical protein [Spiroplasma litorale]AKX33849.1 thiamine pyrophosphokinase [Spiroplasma litorale]